MKHDNRVGIDETTTVRDLVVKHPETRQVLESLGVDYCCGGGHRLVEHENAGKALGRMRSLTDDYTLPEDACPTFSALFDGLRELEADLHEHIHLENNILFPRTAAMEGEGGA